MDYQAKTNWTYNDTVTEQDMNRIEAGLGDLHQRLDTPATSKLVLQPGTQTIQVERDTPFHLSGISGRMLLNLLGRNGNCESLNGWAFSGTAALNTSQFVAGTASIQITAGSGGGIMSRSVELKVGKTYVLAASIKLGTATGAAVSVTGIMNGSVVNSSSNFMTSYMRFTATSSTHSIAVVLQATQGQTAYVDAIRLYEISAAEYSQLSSMTASQVDQMYPYTEGLAGVKNPYAIRWTDNNKSQIAGMFAFDTELLASPTADTDADREVLSVGADGQYYKTSIYSKITLSGALNWRYGDAGGTVFKQVAVNGLVVGAVAGSGTAIKYEGKVLPQGNTGTVSDTQAVSGSGDFFISIPQADSGWGDSYIPTADEIKAYFYGWVMYDGSQPTNNPNNSIYNGSGTKAWARRTDGVSRTFTDPTATLPTTQATAFTPYELMYRRSSTYNVAVASEGALSLTQGDNYIEVGAGVVIREPVKPQPSSTFYWINGNTPSPSALKNKTIKFLQVYRNNRPDPWTFLGFSTDADKVTYGLQQAQVSADKFSADDVYSVTYIPMQYYPTAGFTGSISDNERAILNDLVHDVELMTRRVSVTELRKADISINWITPTLLNGWTNYNPYFTGVGYNKDALGYVHIKGVIASGAGNAVIFKLPAGFRPYKVQPHIVAVNTNGTTDAIGRINIHPDGDVIYYLTNISPTIGSGGWVSLANMPPFLAEQ